MFKKTSVWILALFLASGCRSDPPKEDQGKPSASGEAPAAKAASGPEVEGPETRTLESEEGEADVTPPLSAASALLRGLISRYATSDGVDLVAGLGEVLDVVLTVKSDAPAKPYEKLLLDMLRFVAASAAKIGDVEALLDGVFQRRMQNLPKLKLGTGAVCNYCAFAVHGTCASPEGRLVWTEVPANTCVACGMILDTLIPDPKALKDHAFYQTEDGTKTLDHCPSLIAKPDIPQDPPPPSPANSGGLGDPINNDAKVE